MKLLQVLYMNIGIVVLEYVAISMAPSILEGT